ncbi:N-acetylmuramoyl-L-alanine amidase [Pedobacter punctiformis]|uniref:N-acetylmuramoyl-L-alanine amidase n=1 Tax=Pedobacter punctiformis TaxID=3004097 RepID=A0ABT4LBA6_9SPHI|nr:N-acetylmuramoyl-L-alanine amidase [Pedobacter sp. HCMS5-2]MCZ4245199.1 N-acetylmuramoyl-L-alanine amidase [Pedobacter sp. HCMS5-2]
MILIYLLKVSACTAAFYAVYHLLLAKLTFFNLNRIYLLVMLVLSFSIPALTIESRREVVASDQVSLTKVVYNNDGAAEKDFQDDEIGTSNNNTDWNQMFEYAYYSILALFILRMLFMMGFVKRELRKHVVDQTGPILLVNAKSVVKNCTFFNHIIIDSALPPEERDLVVKHESIHVQQMHAFDKTLANLAAAVLWFNPVIYLWRNAIDHNHEFLADRETSKTADKKIYASLLLNLAMPSKNFVTNSFSKQPLKSRIMMLYKKPNSKLQKLAYFLIVPVVLVCSLAFINRKETIITKPVEAAKSKTDGLKNEAFEVNYFKNGIVLNPNAKSAFKAVEITLVVDAGHGGKDEAGIAFNGQREKDLNLNAVKILKEEAAKRGIKVILTRNNDQYLTLRDRLPKESATAFISIHHNAAEKDAKAPFNGIEVYVSKLNSNIKVAEELGTGILSKLNQLDGIEVKNSLNDANLFLLRESKVPAVLIELGNISNEKSLDYIKEEKNIRRISNLILDGFVAFSKRGC